MTVKNNDAGENGTESNDGTTANPTLRLGDDLIAVVRELIQLSLLTGTNIVDHMRAVRVETVEGMVVPTDEYVEAYNAQITELQKQAEAQAEEMQKTLAQDAPKA